MARRHRILSLGAILSVTLVGSLILFGNQQNTVIATNEDEPDFVSSNYILYTEAAKEADLAVAEGDLRLIGIHYGWHLEIPGMICYLEPRLRSRAPKILFFGDVRPVYAMDYQGNTVTNFESIAVDYVKNYNQTLLNHPDFPDRDICQVSEPLSASTCDPRFRYRDRDKIVVDWVVPDCQAGLRKLTEGWSGEYREAEHRTLVLASRFGHENTVRKMLESGENPNQSGDWGLSALDWAVLRGSSNIVDLLLEFGADPFFDPSSNDWSNRYKLESARDRGFHPLRWAILGQRYNLLKKLLDLMLENSKDDCAMAQALGRAIEFSTSWNDVESIKLLSQYSENLTYCERIKEAIDRSLKIAEKNRFDKASDWLKSKYKHE